MESRKYAIFNTILNITIGIKTVFVIFAAIVLINYISQQTTIEKVQAEPEVTITFIEPKQMDFNHYTTVQLNVDNILQYPELPTGCEVTSLAIVLNYLGYDIDKVSLSDQFLPKGKIGETHPDKAFIGNPKNKGSFGANAPVIIKTANDYFTYVNSNYKAYDVSSKDFDSLLEHINNGYPVIFWGTMYMEKGWHSVEWTIDNETVKWYAGFHCMVLIGYTEDEYIIADPLQGIVKYNKDLVKQRYSELGYQAMTIF